MKSRWRQLRLSQNLLSTARVCRKRRERHARVHVLNVPWSCRSRTKQAESRSSRSKETRRHSMR